MKRLNESGQMILIAGFIIGIGIVVLTVMLNNIVYASNTASESSIETNVFDFSNVVQTTTEAYEKAYADSNGGVDNATFDAYMAKYSEKMIESYSLSGFIFSLDSGVLQDTYFTENGLADGNDNWVVIERVNYTDYFLLSRLNASTLGNESNKFVIEVNNQSGSTIWSASLFNSSGNINVTVYDSSNTPHYNNDSATIYDFNVTSNQLEGGYFEYFFNNQTAEETYSIKFINGSQAMGTFLISGDLVNWDPFYIERVEVVNSTMKLNKNGHLEINVTIPITLPRGHI
ncbi:hypothetical protein RE476_09165 [Methanolobus mangrovi]|uniref:Uncharacterized protein n=1 Tax=Methanolobus mangrovi TaxID=3072977 RepID=A0AA51YG28_9EURY|nr:hypothetical protein [Methanolobus mangrovi]WMW21556.1 hypothetical protein RE476_09165 [Methanolobus mangrovi]